MRHLILTLLALSLFACGNLDPDAVPDAFDPPSESAGDEVEVATDCAASGECLEQSAAALRLDDHGSLGIEDIEVREGNLRITLAPGAPTPARLVAGGVLFRGRKDKRPFARMIEAVDREGDVVRVKTRRATLREVFARGRIKRRIPMDFEVLPVQPPAAAPGKADVSLSLGPKDCSGTLFDKSYTNVISPWAGGFTDGHVKIELNQCRFVISGWVDAWMTWGGLTPDAFEFRIGGGIDAALEATLTMDGALVLGDEKTILKLAPIPINVMGLNLTLEPSILAGYSLAASAALEVNAGFQYEVSAEAGFGWAAGTGFYDIWETERSFTQIGPNFEFAGYATATAYLKPRIDVSLWGVVGGFATLKAFATTTISGDATYHEVAGWQGEVCSDVTIGIQPTVGASAIILGDEELQLPAIQKKFDGGCQVAAIAAGDACDETNVCATDLDCGITDCRLGRCAAEKGCTCVYDHEIEGCCETAADCDDGDPSTDDVCLLGTCGSTHVPGFCGGEDGCDDGLAYTTDTCNLLTNKCEHSAGGGKSPSLGSDECASHDDCDDGLDATTDSCIAGACKSIPPVTVPDCEATCDDANALTEDECVDGVCVHTFKSAKSSPGLPGR